MFGGKPFLFENDILGLELNHQKACCDLKNAQ